jgi:hypothetical protein
VCRVLWLWFFGVASISVPAGTGPTSAYGAPLQSSALSGGTRLGRWPASSDTPPSYVQGVCTWLGLPCVVADNSVQSLARVWCHVWFFPCVVSCVVPGSFVRAQTVVFWWRFLVYPRIHAAVVIQRIARGFLVRLKRAAMPFAFLQARVKGMLARRW